MKLSPAASIFTTACPAHAVGSAISSSFITSGPPGAWTRIAFMGSSPGWKGVAGPRRVKGLALEEPADLLHHPAPPVQVTLPAEGATGLQHLLLDLLGLDGRALDEARHLVHVLVEEGEDGNGAVQALVEVLVHQLLVLVAEEDPHLDVGIALHHLGQHRHVVERVPAPVLGDHEHVQLLAVLVERPLVGGVDLDGVEELDELVLVRPHLREVLLDRHALLELLLGDHETPPRSQRMAERSTVNVETSFSSGLRTTSVKRPVPLSPAAGNT